MTGAVLILHDLGAAEGGRPWRDAFLNTNSWGDVVALDAPGHGDSPPPRDGAYSMTDAAFGVARFLATDDGSQFAASGFDTVVGIGVGGWSAQLLALAGRTKRLVLVDGLGAPFISPEEFVAQRFARMRMIEAVATPVVADFAAPHGDRELAERVASEMPVPVLLLGADQQVARELAEVFAAGADCEAVGPSDPVAIASAAAQWRRAT